MSKKITHQKKAALHKKELAIENPRRLKKIKLFIGLSIAVLGFLFYSNTLHHNYAFDDFTLIKYNYLTKQGSAALKEILLSDYHSGYYQNENDLYRPLSKAMFALEWQIAPDKPAFSHWMNVLLYAFTGFLLFIMLTLYLPERIWLCAITSLLFIIHPIHTEAVANIKSRDEILSFLFFILTAICAFHFITGKTKKYVWLIGSLLSFFLSLLSKESAITFVAVVPLMIWFFTDVPFKKQLAFVASMFFVAIMFLLLRARILEGGHAVSPTMMDNLLLAANSRMIRFTTAVFILGIYLKLLVYPYPLVSDNSYDQIPLVGLSDWHFIVSFLIFAGLGIYAVFRFRKKNIYSFGVLFFFITLSVTSNIFFLTGTSYGERFLYAPSFGFCLAMSSALMRIFDAEKIMNKKLSILLAAITIIFFVITHTRNKAWKDDYTLHSSDVLSAPNSAKAHYYFGSAIISEEHVAKINNPVIKQAVLDTGIKEMRKTISIYPSADAFDKIGYIYSLEQKFDSAIFYYQKALSLIPGNSSYLNSYGIALFNAGRLDEAQQQLEHSLQINPDQPKTNCNLAIVYGSMAQQFAAQNKTEEEKQYYTMAIFQLKKCVKPEPFYAYRYYMIGNAYRKLGDETNAQHYLDIAKSLNPKFK